MVRIIDPEVLGVGLVGKTGFPELEAELAALESVSGEEHDHGQQKQNG